MAWGQESYKQVFTYDSPDRLKDLVGLLSDENIELSVLAGAIVSKEFKDLRDGIDRHVSYPYRHVSLETSDLLKLSVERLVLLANEAKVFPFVSLKHDGYRPDIENNTPHFNEKSGTSKIIIPSVRDPRFMLDAWKFYMIWLKDAREKEQIQRFKEAVKHMPECYETYQISAGLNPQDWGGGCNYHSGTDFDARLFAAGGKVEITWNKKPEDTSKAIPPQMLEGLVKLGFKPAPEALPEPVNT